MASAAPGASPATWANFNSRRDAAGGRREKVEQQRDVRVVGSGGAGVHGPAGGVVEEVGVDALVGLVTLVLLGGQRQGHDAQARVKQSHASTGEDPACNDDGGRPVESGGGQRDEHK